jgi:glyoxylase I family protein
MFIRGFHHVAIQLRDLDRAASFYCGVLGLPQLAQHHREDGSLRSLWVGLPDGGFLALEGCEGPASHSPYRRSEPGLLLLALRIGPEDRQRAISHFREHGVEIVHQTRWTIYVRDPEGNRIGLSHHPHEAS